MMIDIIFNNRTNYVALKYARHVMLKSRRSPDEIRVIKAFVTRLKKKVDNDPVLAAVMLAIYRAKDVGRVVKQLNRAVNDIYCLELLRAVGQYFLATKNSRVEKAVKHLLSVMVEDV